MYKNGFIVNCLSQSIHVQKLEINSSHIERTPEDHADDFEITIYF